jgi:uncharacterized membrane protein YkvA (DUF1232 family)
VTGATDETTIRNDFWPKLRQNLVRLPFAEDAVASYYCAFDATTPLKVKGILVAALAYFIMPFDVIPDFLLGLGFTDDLAVLVSAMGMVRKHITEIHRDKARSKIAELRSGHNANS